MALPNVSITIEGGGLGRVPSLSDGEAGLLITGKLPTAPAAFDMDKPLENTYLRPVQIGSPKDLDALSIDSTGAHVAIRKQVNDFYKEAGEGAPLWLMLLPTGATSTFAKVFEVGGAADKITNTSGGRVRLLGVAHRNSDKTTATDGLKYGLHEAVTQGQAFALLQQKAARPLSILIGGDEAALATLKDYAGGSNNRVSLLISSDKPDKRAAVGLVLGRLAKLPVQRSLARVKTGALPVTQGYFTDGNTTESKAGSWAALHDKRYIFFRNYTGLSGYYVNDGLALTSATDDTATISLGRTIDKAVRLAYTTYIEEVAEEVILEDGKLAAAHVKYLESKIENVINETMTNAGEISSVEAAIDTEQNILSTDKLEVVLSLVPVGYTKNIEVKIGFVNPTIQ